MRTIIILVMMVFFSSLAYCNIPKGILKDEAIRRAKECAEASSPPMDSSHKQEAQAIYLKDENVWIVDFVDQSSTVSFDSDYMVKVEAISGKYPELLRGSQKQTYKSFFKNIENNDE